MTYEEALQKINDRLLFGVKPGLERIQALCDALGNPEKRTRFVHVAGTNGKGTTCTLIASVLHAAGYRTGLYTSPYVLDFRERFRIDGEMIPKTELVEAVERVLPAAEKLEAAGETVTEFEFITALALDWFARRGCDFVVLEVGLGGRMDATNVIDTPEAAAIASISLDHTAVLGDTLEQIAFEKAGIIKSGGAVAVYADNPECVVREISTICAERGAKLHIADESRMQMRGTACWNGIHVGRSGAHDAVHRRAPNAQCRDSADRGRHPAREGCADFRRCAAEGLFFGVYSGAHGTAERKAARHPRRRAQPRLCRGAARGARDASQRPENRGRDGHHVR